MNQDDYNQLAAKIVELDNRLQRLEAQANPYGVGSAAGSTEVIKGLAEAVKARYAGR